MVVVMQHFYIFNYFRTLVCISMWVMMTYHEHVFQQSQITSSTFFAITQSSHLDLFVNLWVVGSLLKPHTDSLEIKTDCTVMVNVILIVEIQHHNKILITTNTQCVNVNVFSNTSPLINLSGHSAALWTNRKCKRVINSPVYLAGVQHFCDGSSAEVSCGDDVFLTTRVPSSHCLCCCHSYSFGHANELLWCGGLCWGVRAVEHLCGYTGGLIMRYLVCLIQQAGELFAPVSDLGCSK